LYKIFQLIDSDNSGQIDYSGKILKIEFLVALIDDSIVDDKRIQDAFDYFDFNQ